MALDQWLLSVSYSSRLGGVKLAGVPDALSSGLGGVELDGVPDALA